MTLYIIPAYEETTRNQGYRHIIAEAKKRKYNIRILNLQIKGRLLSDLVGEGIKAIGNYNDCVLFGFSTGALIAFCISKKIPIKKGVFCSISPIFGKDSLDDLKLHQKYFGKNIVEELKMMRYGKSLADKKIFICGDGEGKKMISRMTKICKTNKEKLILVTNNDHELNVDYVNTILKFV